MTLTRKQSLFCYFIFRKCFKKMENFCVYLKKNVKTEDDFFINLEF